MLTVNNFWRKLMTMRRYRVTDREAPEVHTVEKIGRTQALTPEGFLLCSDVPIKRTGEMRYGPGETPIKVGDDGVAYVTRDAEALFTDQAIASYMGKPVVNDHPDADVTPSNWKQLAVGICLNPRRGVGDAHDVMVADLLITDAATIRDVRAGKREVSAGYEADYEQLGSGRGRQTNIIGNHIALVDKGRCGPRCAIGDHLPTSLKEKPMGIKTRRRITDTALARVRRIFQDAQAEALEQLGNSGQPEGEGMDDEGISNGDGGDSDNDDNHTHIHIHSGESAAPAAGAGAAPADDGTMTQDDPIEARFQAIESSLAQIMQMLQGGGEQAPAAEAPPPPTDETKDGVSGAADLPGGGGDEMGDIGADDGKTADRAKTGDSAALHTSYQTLLSDAEVLYPGFRLPTFDSALPRAKTVDNMCALRRQVLSSAYITADGKALIDGVAGGANTDVAKLTCDAAAVIFRAAAGAKRLLNNRTSVGDASKLPASFVQHQGSSGGGGIAAINAQNKAYWEKQKQQRSTK